MKKFYALIAAVVLVAITSCSKDEDNYAYIYLTVKEYSVSGSDDTTPVETYFHNIADAYMKAFGMIQSASIVVEKQNYDNIVQTIKRDFDKVSLPEAPTTELTYDFTFVIIGTYTDGDSDKIDEIASRTFTNKEEGGEEEQ